MILKNENYGFYIRKQNKIIRDFLFHDMIEILRMHNGFIGREIKKGTKFGNLTAQKEFNLFLK